MYSLVTVAGYGDVKSVKRFLEDPKSRAYINSYKNHNQTPLYAACINGHADCARVLLENGADPNLGHALDPHATPLVAAIDNGWTECVRVLIEYKANVSYTMVRRMNINGVDRHDHTSLTCIAILRRSDECLELLLKAGADPNFVITQWFEDDDNPHFNETTVSLLYIAIVTNSTSQAIKLLLEAGANPCYFMLSGDRYGHGNLHTKATIFNHLTHRFAAFNNYGELSLCFGYIKVLIERGYHPDTFVTLENKSLLQICTNRLYINEIVYLIEHGANIEWTDANGDTLLISIVQNTFMDTFRGTRMIINHLRRHCPEKLEKLINAKNIFGSTALDAAAIRGKHVEMFLLLQCGAEPSSIDVRGYSILHNTILLGLGQKEPITYLIDFGADVSAETPDGDSLLTLLAKNHPHLAKDIYVVMEKMCFEWSPQTHMAVLCDKTLKLCTLSTIKDYWASPYSAFDIFDSLFLIFELTLVDTSHDTCDQIDETCFLAYQPFELYYDLAKNMAYVI